MEVDAIIDLHKVLYQHQGRAPARDLDAAARTTTVAIPVRALEGAKSRLAPCSTPRSATTWSRTCCAWPVHAALATPGVGDVFVVSPDPEVLAVAEAAGARPLPQRSRGLNPALQEAREAAAGADRLLILPGDLRP